jgi:hypothetical protein
MFSEKGKLNFKHYLDELINLHVKQNGSEGVRDKATAQRGIIITVHAFKCRNVG